MFTKIILAIVMMSAGMLAVKYFTHRSDRKKIKVKSRKKSQNRVENLVWDEKTQTYRPTNRTER